MRIVSACTMLALLCGCAKTASFYPTNDVAAAGGVLKADYVAYGTGHVNLTLSMPDGEVLKGEASVVRGGSIAFGSIIASASGPRGTAFASGTTISYGMES